jgi:hypothetical protein
MTSALVGDKWSDSRPGRFILGERAPGTRGWVDPRAGLDDLEKWKFLLPKRLELPLVVQPVASRYTDCAIPDWMTEGSEFESR